MCTLFACYRSFHGFDVVYTCLPLGPEFQTIHLAATVDVKATGAVSEFTRACLTEGFESFSSHITAVHVELPVNWTRADLVALLTNVKQLAMGPRLVTKVLQFSPLSAYECIMNVPCV